VTCGVDTEGRGYCWGAEWAAGRGGWGNAAPVPQALAVNRTWAALDAGGQLVCGLTRAGETFCWGDERAAVAPVPAPVPGAPEFATITVGDAHACGLTRDGVAYCWGSDVRGQTGAGRAAAPAWRRPDATPVAGGLRFAALRAGPESTCGLVAPGDVYCWGGSEVIGEAVEPRPVQRGFAFTALEYGGSLGGRGVACAQSGAGAVSCFGYVPHERLPQPAPVAVPAASPVQQMAVGGAWTPPTDLYRNGDAHREYQAHACALDAAGVASCWGTNDFGQLGDGTTADRASPVAVGLLAGAAQVTAGGAHSCAVTGEGVAYCWGANRHGQLGTGTAGGALSTPQRVATPQR